MPNLSSVLRAAILAAQKASPQITALIAKESIYPSTVPASAAWPFSRIGSIIVSPYVADGLRSISARVLIQGVSKGLIQGTTLILPAEDHVYQIGDAFQSGLDNKVLALPGGGTIKVEWERTICLMGDGEPASWYVTSTFEAEVTPP